MIRNDLRTPGTNTSLGTSFGLLGHQPNQERSNGHIRSVLMSILQVFSHARQDSKVVHQIVNSC